MKHRRIVLTLITVLVLVGPAALIEAQGPALAPDGIKWVVDFPYERATLTLSGAEGLWLQQDLAAGEPLYFSIRDAQGSPLPDGGYNYELRFSPQLSDQERAMLLAVADDADRGLGATHELPVVSGHFRIAGGAIVTDNGESEAAGEEGAAPAGGPALADIVHSDDVIIQSSLCVGFDCVNGESFGFDTIRLKEKNLRLHFDDTSASASFPRNDWRIVINDSSNGGASYFAIEDATAGRVPFRIEAGASRNSLYVEDDGDVGLGTSMPVVDLHIASGNTPAVRLDQDGSEGWSPQIWDVAGNEINFFVRDVTNGSRLILRIRPGAPTDSLEVESNGDVSFKNKIQIRSDADHAYVGSIVDIPLHFLVNNATVAELDNEGYLTTYGDIPVGGDVDGDGKMDLILWRPTTGKWHVMTSGSGYTTSWAKTWGQLGDIPVGNVDYDGDGKTDLVVWRPSNDRWYFFKSTTNFTAGESKTFGGVSGSSLAEGEASTVELTAEDTTATEGLAARVQALEERVKQLEAQNQSLEERLAALEARLSLPQASRR